MPELRILLADLEREWRGGQNQALLLLQGLRDRGHDAHLLSVSGAVLAGYAADAGVPVHAVSAAIGRMQAARLMRRLLAQRRFDLIHANEAHALTSAWLARVHRHVPLVLSRRVLFPLRRSAISLARYRAASRILAVSTAVRAGLCEAGLDASRIEVVADGVELAPPITEAERSQARAHFALPADAPVAAYVASFTAEKGHILLLDSFAEIRRAMPSSRLLLAGAGPLEHALRRRAQDAGALPAVCFAGMLEDLRLAFAACDVFLFPSLCEGLGSALLSAMSYALPVVALQGRSIGDVLDDGTNGLVVAPESTGLAKAAMRLFTDKALAERLGTAARQTVKTRFSAGRMVDATARTYESLMPVP